MKHLRQLLSRSRSPRRSQGFGSCPVSFTLCYFRFITAHSADDKVFLCESKKKCFSVFAGFVRRLLVARHATGRVDTLVDIQASQIIRPARLAVCTVAGAGAEVGVAHVVQAGYAMGLGPELLPLMMVPMRVRVTMDLRPALCLSWMDNDVLLDSLAWKATRLECLFHRHQMSRNTNVALARRF